MNVHPLAIVALVILSASAVNAQQEPLAEQRSEAHRLSPPSRDIAPESEVSVSLQPGSAPAAVWLVTNMVGFSGRHGHRMESYELACVAPCVLTLARRQYVMAVLSDQTSPSEVGFRRHAIAIDGEHDLRVDLLSHKAEREWGTALLLASAGILLSGVGVLLVGMAAGAFDPLRDDSASAVLGTTMLAFAGALTAGIWLSVQYDNGTISITPRM